MRENINSNFYIPSVKYTYTTLPVNFQRNQITDNTITSSRSNKSMTHFPHLRKIRYFTRVVIIKPLIRFFFFSGIGEPRKFGGIVGGVRVR